MEDRDIVELFWNRDPAAIRAVSEKYGKLCGTLARNILGSREDAETFLELRDPGIRGVIRMERTEK